MPWNNDWNNSALETLEKCGERFRRQYIEDDGEPATSRMHRGSAVHWVIKEGHKRQMANRGRLPADVKPPAMANEPGTIEAAIEAEDLAATAFARAVDNGVTFTREEEQEGKAAVLGRAKDFAVAASSFYTSEVAPAVDPFGVELRVDVRPQNSDITIHGTMDLVDDAEHPDGAIIRDPKTSEKSPAKDAADRSQQLSMYALLELARSGKLPRLMQLDYIVRTPARLERKHVPLYTRRDMEDVEAMINRINTGTEAVKRGVFVPARETDWWCSPNWCPFFRTCVYVGRRRRPEG